MELMMLNYTIIIIIAKITYFHSDNYRMPDKYGYNSFQIQEN